jgi:hypothetical protein
MWRSQMTKMEMEMGILLKSQCVKREDATMTFSPCELRYLSYGVALNVGSD